MDGKKLFAVLVGLLMTVFIAAPAPALVTSFYEKACVVPYAFSDGAGVDTSIGVQISDPSLGGAIYWSFFNADGAPLLSRSIPVQAGKQQYGISLGGSGGSTVLNQTGWILITWDNDGTQTPGETGQNVAASCFLIDLANNDAAVIPVVPVDPTDFQNTSIDLLAPPVGPLVFLVNGAYTPNHQLLVNRFLISPSGDPSTTLIIFTAVDAPTQYSASMITADGTVQPGISLPAAHTKLNIYNVQSYAPSGFTDGAIRVVNPSDDTNPIGVMFAIIKWSVVGAAQTSTAFED